MTVEEALADIEKLGRGLTGPTPVAEQDTLTPVVAVMLGAVVLIVVRNAEATV